MEEMSKYKCKVCGYVYDPHEGDPDHGVAAETSFADLPEDWVCPLCGVGKEEFEREGVSGMRIGKQLDEILDSQEF